MSDLMVFSVFLTLLCDCQRARTRSKRFGNSQENSQDSMYSRKRYNLWQQKDTGHNQQKEKMLDVKTGGNQVQTSRVFSQYSHTGWIVTTYLRCCQRKESWLETQHPKFLLAAGHRGTPCLAYTQISNSENESRCSA